MVDNQELAQYIVNIEKELRDIKAQLTSKEKPLDVMITDRLNRVKCEICEKYCRYADKTMDRVEFELICEKCPLTRL